MERNSILMDKLVALAKRRGFVFPTSEIYGGLSSSYDYGPLGVEMIRNIKNLWWEYFIHNREDMVGLDSQILLHPRTWEASGHVTNFNDPLVEDKKTHKRYRIDHLIQTWLDQNPQEESVVVENMSFEELAKFAEVHKLKSPEDNELTPPRKFNILFTTSIGTIEETKSLAYLRGETAQGIFTNFANVVNSMRVEVPFGIGQIGKSFRNEITSGQFIFRTLEFEQAEIEYFFDPEKTDWEVLMKSWKEAMWGFVTKTLGVSEDHLRWRRHTDKERSHYSKDTYDLDYLFPFGWKELWGIAYRTDYDLKQHMQFSGMKLTYRDPESGREYVPHVIEPAVGFGRLTLMVLTEAYTEDNDRLVLRLSPKLAPYKVAVFPLLRNKPDLVQKAREIFTHLKQKRKLNAVFDDRGNIGKRYFAQDEIGTPWCITIDFQSLEDNTVTVRDRDTTKQARLGITELDEFFTGKLT
jgi:glycyl-tRNA synthetase